LRRLLGFNHQTNVAQVINSNAAALVVPAPSPDDTNAVAAALNDIKAPVHIPDYWLWLWIAIAVTVLAVAAYLLWKFWLKRKLEKPPLPPVPPHVRARRRLTDALALMSDPMRFVVVVSDAIRIYLEERFQFRAPERTTEEFLYELQNTDLLTPDQKQSLGDFLTRCDLVKFARYEPTQVELEDLYKSAMRLVEETEPTPNVPEAHAPVAEPVQR
jgi:hypothetical protein